MQRSAPSLHSKVLADDTQLWYATHSRGNAPRSPTVLRLTSYNVRAQQAPHHTANHKRGAHVYIRHTTPYLRRVIRVLGGHVAVQSPVTSPPAGMHMHSGHTPSHKRGAHVHTRHTTPYLRRVVRVIGGHVAVPLAVSLTCRRRPVCVMHHSVTGHTPNHTRGPHVSVRHTTPYPASCRPRDAAGAAPGQRLSRQGCPCRVLS